MGLKLIVRVGLASLFGLVITTSITFAVEVKFFRQYDAYGQLIRYEKNGEFSHVAISFQGGWLHAHPYGGVSVLKSLSHLGMDYVILENKNYPEPSVEFVKSQLQKKFDVFAQWNDPGKTYCSKLIAEFFAIKPRKMFFKSQNWKFIKTPRGQKGISPDEVYFELVNKFGFEKKVDLLRDAFGRVLQKNPNSSPRCLAYLRS